MPLSVKAANLSKFFPVWTVTREQWADGVVIDTLLFSRIGSPLCHRYRTGIHAAFWGTYLRRLHAFLDESDSAVVRRLHRRLARELASRVVLPTDGPASVQPRSTVGHRTVSRSRRPRRLKGVTNSAGGPESSCRLPAEMSSVQALMDLALPRLAGLADGPCQVHPQWSVASDSLASPAPTQLDPSGEGNSRCSMDQTSVSSTYLNLDALSSSSEEESRDEAKRSDLSVTLLCSSEEAGTRVISAEVFLDDDFPAVFGARDIRQVVRRRACSPGGRTIGAAQDDRQHAPPAPVVDLMTGKCKPGKVSRTVSTSPLTLDLTAMCTSGVEVPPPRASTQVVLPPATMAHTVTVVGTSTPFVATPAPVVEQPGCMPRGFRHSGYWSPPSYFRHSDCRPRLPRPHCRGEQRKTRRRPFRPTLYRRGPHRMLWTRTVCSLCHRFHQDSSFGLHGGADHIRLEGSYCRRR